MISPQRVLLGRSEQVTAVMASQEFEQGHFPPRMNPVFHAAVHFLCSAIWVLVSPHLAWDEERGEARVKHGLAYPATSQSKAVSDAVPASVTTTSSSSFSINRLPCVGISLAVVTGVLR